MPFCTKCGSSLPSGAAFCSSCGAPQARTAPPGRPAQPAPGRPAAPMPPVRPAAPIPPARPAAPAYNPYAPKAAAKAGSSLLRWMIPLIALAAVAAVVVVILNAAGIIGKSDEELIRDRIAEFEEAYTSGDYDGMMDCLASDMRAATDVSMGLMDGLMSDMAGFDIGMSDMFGLVGLMGDFCDFIIEDIQIQGDSATVTLTMNMNMYGETSSEQMTLPMVKDGGDWYIGGVSGMIGTDLLNSFY